MVLQLFLGVFLPWGQAAQLTAPQLLTGLVLALFKLLCAVVLIAVLENSVARLRFLKTGRTTWAGFGLAFLALVSWLVVG
ncbi:Formate hydrogenlyase subunit 4 [compost metagenome]